MLQTVGHAVDAGVSVKPVQILFPAFLAREGEPPPGLRQVVFIKAVKGT